MPYIDMDRRREIHRGERPLTPGELNYTITKVILEYLDMAGYRNYAGFNAVIGVLDCVKMELYRRTIVPYEDKKRAENGDVF